LSEEDGLDPVFLELEDDMTGGSEGAYMGPVRVVSYLCYGGGG
jgi:hypothetical protein